MEGKFLKIWGWKTTGRPKTGAGMSSVTRLVIRYKLLSTFLSVSTAAAFQGAPPPEQTPAQEARQAMVQAIDEGRLVSPLGNSAWDHYESFVRSLPKEGQRLEADDQMVIAFASAGDQILCEYRRGEQVVSLDAASYEEGARLFGYASEIAPFDLALQAKAKFMAGQAQAKKGNFSEAARALQQAVSLDPAAAYSYNALGQVYLEQGRWGDAIENFRSATARAGKWIYPRFNLFQAYMQMNRFSDAEEELQIGIEIENELGISYSYLHYNLARLYLYQGRYQEAAVEFRRAQAS